MSVSFTSENQARFEKIVAKYETKASALLPTLWLAQEQFEYLSNEVMDYVASLLGMPPSHVYEAVTFYVMFKRKDMGKFCLQICNNITCSMMGSEKLIQVARDELHIEFHEVTEDKMFSLVPVQCLGSCDTAPVVQVNEEYCENLTPEKFKELIHRLKTGKTEERPGLSCQ
ncbi:MAG: NAD(P)H-dependent oxidoreductase subunit E [Deltaproteobacteria bacterium]|nr:NAD(P)H-dependent oxidoreductase subunit E [Deltaproteobacteria bacterium]